MRIRVGHSPDADDAFMFEALAERKIDTGRYRFEHELVDIETLNRRAFRSELELTALSVHAYAHLTDRYALCNCGASMGDNYGPIVVAREKRSVEELKTATIAVPGTLTTAYLALRLCLGVDFSYVVVPFDRILDVVEKGEYVPDAEGDSPVQPPDKSGPPQAAKGDSPIFAAQKSGQSPKRIDAGLVIHEGQLTYGEQKLELVIDTGRWWMEETGLPLPLGVNALRKDLGRQTMIEVQRLLRQSVEYGLSHRGEALGYALQFGRGLDPAKADEFVGMYVNHWTLDLGPKGRAAVARLLDEGYRAGVIPQRVAAEFVEEG
jgi:1,4-dihydroxy-6-naphthoate synthase